MSDRPHTLDEDLFWAAGAGGRPGEGVGEKKDFHPMFVGDRSWDLSEKSFK